MEQGGNNKGKIMRYVRAGFLLLALAGLLLLARTLYVVFADPMQAFKTPQPALTPVVTPIPATPAPTPAVTASPGATAEPTPEPTPAPTPYNLEYMNNRVNILLLGYDSSPERTVEENDVYRDETNDFRSDVLMLLTVDFENKSVHLISVPRDSYAPIYNDKGELYSVRGKWKINAAFAKGGSEGTRGYKFAMQTVSKLLGVPIDYYAAVDMDGLKGVVNAMGGVYYDVDLTIHLNGRTLKPGYQKLNGQQVLDYVRARKGISTDAGRNDRQQRMLFAIFEQLKSKDQLLNFPKVYRSIKKYINTNMNAEQIAAVAAFGAQLTMDDIHRHTIEGEYRSDTPYSSANYYLIANAKLTALIKSIYGIDIETNPRYDIGYVLADIAAEQGLDDISDAEYLLARSKIKAAFPTDSTGNYPANSPVLALRGQMDALKALCTRPEGSDSNIPLDERAIRAGQSALYARMLELCDSANVSQRDVSKSRLPDAVYNALPAQPATPTPLPDATPAAA
jgi:LCP family protein required for cell wall assembly